MEAAVPRGIRVEISALDEVAAVLGSDACHMRRVLLLFSSSEDALKAHRAGAGFSELNLGNMHAGEGKMRYSCTIALDAEDIENLGLLEEDGVQIVSQCIPSDRRQHWRKMIKTTSGK
jgi:mannose/fructose/N-acetylgalactosamine-specific phosphotransferase system component IIB